MTGPVFLIVLGLVLFIAAYFTNGSKLDEKLDKILTPIIAVLGVLAFVSGAGIELVAFLESLSWPKL